uniref:Flavin-containing monooxygenase n=1 Tax=Cyprinus carpio carpio TaxID=630221 RepID=A0A8C1DUC7_CYPCA
KNVSRYLRRRMIGGGPAGLCAARHILSRPEAFDPPVVYEMTDHLGGTWFYEEQVGTYENGYPIHSSMYRDFRTNLAKEIMMFPDFPFDDHLPSFLHHKSVQQYLEKYCEKHDIAHYIKVYVCLNSKFCVCFKLKGTENLKNRKMIIWKVLHSHSYRYPEPFTNKSVVVLGARASGVDISIEIAQVKAQVFITPTMSLPPPLGIRQAGAVIGVSEDGSLQFQDGSVIQADIVLFCTGHKFNFPFLFPSGTGCTGSFCDSTVQVLAAPGFPSIFFIGICKIICPFIHFDCQVKFSLAVLEGSAELPTQEEMEKEVQREMQRKQDTGVQVKNLLNLDKDQREYYLDMAKVGRFTAPQSVFEIPNKVTAKPLRISMQTQWCLVYE